MSARLRFTNSLQALLLHLDAGGIQDTALPGTPTSEATRLMKNGLSVSAFACFEHFVRERIAELLSMIRVADDLPPFEDLPERLQLAATKGVIEAVRFRLNSRSETLATSDIVTIAQSHAKAIASSAGSSYLFSDWAFGWASPNVGAGTLSDFLAACNAGKLFNEVSYVLQDVDFDYSAAGLAEGGGIRLGRIASWRHEAAHDATLSIDVALLRTRITVYLSVAFAFDFLASFAARVLIDSFGMYGSCDLDRSFLKLRQLVPMSTEFELQELDATPVRRYYSLSHCHAELQSVDSPLTGAVVVRDAQQQIVDWFFY